MDILELEIEALETMKVIVGCIADVSGSTLRKKKKWGINSAELINTIIS